MEIDIFMQMISSVGFPIACVVALGVFVWKGVNIIIENNKAREQQLYATIKEVREQLTKSAETNASFIKVLEVMSKDIEDIKEQIKG